MAPSRTVEQAKSAQHARMRSYALEQGGIFLLEPFGCPADAPIKQPRLRAEYIPNASLNQRLEIVADIIGAGQTIILKRHPITNERRWHEAESRSSWPFRYRRKP